MSLNLELPRRYFADSSQLTNWILGSGATCHMTPEISDFVPSSLLEIDKYIEVEDSHLVTEKKTREVQIKMRNAYGKAFTATLYNVPFSPELCDKLFSIWFYLVLTNRTWRHYRIAHR